MEIPPEVRSAAPGVFGSLVATLWIHDTWPRRFAMFLAGAAFSRYGTATAVSWSGLDEGFAGFLLGLFGMALVSGAFEALKANPIGPIFTEWLRQVLRLPPKPAKEGE